VSGSQVSGCGLETKSSICQPIRNWRQVIFITLPATNRFGIDRLAHLQSTCSINQAPTAMRIQKSFIPTEAAELREPGYVLPRTRNKLVIVTVKNLSRKSGVNIFDDRPIGNDVMINLLKAKRLFTAIGKVVHQKGEDIVHYISMHVYNSGRFKYLQQ